MSIQDYLTDNNHRKSSKRLCGVVFLFSALFICQVTSFVCLFHNPAGEEMIKFIIGSLMITGGSLLGIGIVEKFSKNEK